MTTLMTEPLTESVIYTLPALPYAPDALQPVLSSQILELHHGTHHAGYVKAANELVEKLAELPAADDPSALLRSLSFNVGAHVLHSLFWKSMTPSGSAASAVSAPFNAAIERDFGSHATMTGRMTNAVAKLSGSGWATLSWEPIGRRLVVGQLHDHQHDHILGAVPLLVIDGWEHAYYLQYQSKRADWAKAFFDVADWAGASERFAVASGA